MMMMMMPDWVQSSRVPVLQDAACVNYGHIQLL
jgi:hypothetical protein